MRIVAPVVGLVCLSLPAFGAPQESERQSVLIGPGSISTTHHADQFVSCSMSRSASDLEITFVKKQDGLLLTLELAKMEIGARQILHGEVSVRGASRRSQGIG